jgi:hypothetical protein
MKRSNFRIIDGDLVMLGEFTFFYHTGDPKSEEGVLRNKGVLENEARPVVEWLLEHVTNMKFEWDYTSSPITRRHPQQADEMRLYGYGSSGPLDPDTLFAFKMRWC